MAASARGRRRSGGPGRALTVVLVTALLVAACGSESGPRPAGPDDKVTLRMSWWGSNSRHAYTQKIIDLFEAKHPNITVEPDYSTFDDYWPKLSSSLEGREAPDVIQQDTKYLREYARRGALGDLGPHVGREINSVDFDYVATGSGEIDGTLYGLPTGINAYGIVTNPALFAKAGVRMPDDFSWTWDQFLSTARAVSKGSPRGSYGLQDPGSADILLEIFARQHGENLYTQDGRLGVSRETLTEYYSLLARFRDSGGTPPGPRSVETSGSGVDSSLLTTGKGAMAMFWTNQLGALTQASGQRLVMLRVPGESPALGTYFKPAMFWSMSAKTKHPVEAAMLIDFLLNDPEAAQLTLSDRGLPINLVNREAIVPYLTPADRAAASYIAKLRPSVRATPPLPPAGSSKIPNLVKDINKQLLLKKVTPAQAADSFLTQANAALAPA